MKIAVKDLKALCKIILTKMETSGFDYIEIDIDLYRNISFEDTCNLNTETPEFLVGSLVDDWNSLKKVLDKQNPPTIVDFERLGTIIKLIGNSINLF